LEFEAWKYLHYPAARDGEVTDLPNAVGVEDDAAAHSASTLDVKRRKD
jgi:hypothetical protein